MADLKAQLAMSPENGVEYFRKKGEVLSWDWHDVQKEQHAHAFTVAKVTQLDVLRTIRQQVDRAIDGGASFDQFKKTLRPQLQNAGWWGKTEVLDGGTGELTQAQLGSDRRLRTIFQTNVQTSYMAGLFTQFLGNAEDRPYWQYTAVMDGRTRPAHAAMHGKIYRYDDPVWSIIFPPNGWGCRCRVVPLTEAEALASGLPILSGADSIVERSVMLGKDGPEVTVRGIKYTDEAGNEHTFWPDPGWDYNPGQRWSTFDADASKSESIAAPSATATKPGADTLKPAPGNKTWADAGRPTLDAPTVPKVPNPGLLPMPQSAAEANTVVVQELVPGGATRVIKTPVDQVALRPELLADATNAGDLESARYVRFVVPTLERPFEVWLTPYEDGSYRTRYVSLIRAAVNMLSLVRLNRDGSIFWEVYPVTSSSLEQLNLLRQGTLLFGAK